MLRGIDCGRFFVSTSINACGELVRLLIDKQKRCATLQLPDAYDEAIHLPDNPDAGVSDFRG